MKLEKKLEEIINEEIVFDDELRKEVKFIDNERFLMKVFNEGDIYIYLLLCKLNNQSIEVLQLVDEEVAIDNNDTVYSFVDNKNLLLKLNWNYYGDIQAYDVRAYEYRFEDDKLVLGEIRYTDLVKKPDMTDVREVGLTLINAIDNNYYPYSDIEECFKSLCIKWGEELNWELYEKVITYLEEETEIDLENYLDV